MTDAELLAAVEKMDAERAAAYEDARAEIVSHIRKAKAKSPAARGWRTDSSGQWRSSLSFVEKVETLCGAEGTTEDFGWGDTRSAKSLAYVKCEACRELRTA